MLVENLITRSVATVVGDDTVADARVHLGSVLGIASALVRAEVAGVV